MNIEYVDTIVVHTALSNTVSESATICIHICMYVYVCMRRCLCKVAHSFLALLLGSSAGIIFYHTHIDRSEDQQNREKPIGCLALQGPLI